MKLNWSLQALQADVSLKKELFKEINESKDIVVTAAEGYNDLLTAFSAAHPLASPVKEYPSR